MSHCAQVLSVLQRVKEPSLRIMTSGPALGTTSTRTLSREIYHHCHYLYVFSLARPCRIRETVKSPHCQDVMEEKTIKMKASKFLHVCVPPS